MNPKAAEHFNKKGEELRNGLRTTNPALAAKPTEAKGRKKIDFEVAATIVPIGEVKLSRTDARGNIVEREFVHNGTRLVLGGEEYQQFATTARAIYKTPEFRDSVSEETVADLAFEWIKESHRNNTNKTLIDFIEGETAQLVKKVEIWIPIAWTRIESEFEFGKVIFKTITRQMLTEHEDEIRKAIQKQGDIVENAVEYRFKRDRQKLLGLASATLVIEAERQRAYEIASSEALNSIALLRCLNPLNGFPFFVSYSLPLGHEHVPSYDYFFVEEGKMKGSSSGTTMKRINEWRINDKFLNEIKGWGFETLSNLLKIKQTSFQEELLGNLLLYSQSCLHSNLADRLAYIITPLEGLLRLSTEEPLQALMERFALMIDQDLQVRRNSMTILEKVYGIKLNQLHAEVDETLEKVLEQFFFMAWTFFMNVISLSERFKTKAEFLRAVDDRLMSGGLT